MLSREEGEQMGLVAENKILAITNHSEFIQQIDYFIKKMQFLELEPSNHISEEFTKIIVDLELFVKSDSNNKFFLDLLNSKLINEKVSKIRKYYSIYETLLEFKESLYILSKDKISSDQLKRTYAFAHEEGLASQINENSRVLFIGSGPFPETAIAYTSKFNCCVDCLDNNLLAFFLSSELIKRIGLSGKIKILLGDGTDFDASNYTHIVVAAMANRKKKILKNICEKSNKESLIICRTCSGLRSLIYEPLDEVFLEHYEILGKISNKSTIMHSLILSHKPHDLNRLSPK